MPAHTGELLPAVAVGCALIITFTVAVAEQVPLLTVTVYIPEAAAVTFAIEGFCEVDVNPFGPVHE